MDSKKIREFFSFFGEKEGLAQFSVEITQRCNSRCIFCSSNSSPETIKHEIPIEKLKELSDFGKSKGLKTLNVSGGEPFEHPHLIDFIKYNSANGIKTNVYTSGNFSEEKLDNLLSQNISNKDLKLTFNYQSAVDEVFQKLTNAAPFSVEDVNRYIKKVVDSGYTVGAHMVPNKLNINTLQMSVEKLQNLGVSNIGLLRMVIQERALDNKDELSLEEDPYIVSSVDVHNGLHKDIVVIPKFPDRLISVLRSIKSLQNSNCRIKVGVPFSSFVSNGHKCEAGLNKLVVRYDGTVFPCEAFKGNEILKKKPWLRLGSIYENSLDDIYENGLYSFCALRLDTAKIEMSVLPWSEANMKDYPKEYQDKIKKEYKDMCCAGKCPMNDYFRHDLACYRGLKRK